ncbi:hypothetical protein [Brevibacillus brevis]|uniref:hypothetical protein n=1 Tax=Brevibacillus brevis TaxID=1393 RepID=UPI000D10C21B|nr:hypothetical protein [Brevibacillus brevis]PSJ66326.1 hypothetical protein C7J99_26685 [Brevibacillus brevis]RED21841.1 hypothetical protein DES34_118106 [Brevibacillus brevis]GEC93082.1 hypothetical protein BBR01nite_54130 [Brevibacillus brevis]VEF92704.1 Uncharacterised protein [Brevibacillus brevis]
MNVNDRLKEKGIVSNELLGGKFDRMATYKTDGTLRIEATPDFQDGKWIEGQQIVLQNWDEIERLRNFLNSLKPVKQPEEVVIHAATA